MTNAASLGGIVLCGGRSSRMGTPKATLPFDGETLLERVVRRLSLAVETVVVVGARGQELPALPPEVMVVRDRREFRGPLEGLAGGLAALSGRCEAAFATGCDAPFLRPEFVRRVLQLLEEKDVAVPRAGGFLQPLAAAYRMTVRPALDELLAADMLRPAFLFERVRVREIAVEELIDVDPQLESLRNLNWPEDYRQALEG
jgi:molybdopterin-guanine dinucleotide biosynthesis protein A